ncbi:hypothetical protein F66182_9547 [Fusarium sp. NRRL 66182]|nr:hypothetical protein F66182_9547 [Fusarium sp. NRRL 66182]
MPASTIDTPAVALSFANNFWGKDDAGVGPLLSRMAAAKTTCDELRSFYGGSQESGTLKTSLDTVRGEVEQMAKQHQSIGAEMKSELEEPLAAFGGGMKERRKIIQNTVEKLLKTKMQQTQTVNKTRDKYEQECLKIKGYLAQGHMVMGQEERRNKAKLEKTQISLAASNTEYENAVKALEDTTIRWNREWKSAADKFQDLEEERLDFTKSSLWTFANIASTVCVSDDSSCEKIRLSLEVMDVEKDIITFINEKGTGQEIPDAPKYINFCRGDITDNQSEASEDDNYSVAQFPRNINPAFRSSSPQPSTFESHHDPNSALAKDLAHRDPASTSRREAKAPAHKPATLPPDEILQIGPLQSQPQPPAPAAAAPVPAPAPAQPQQIQARPQQRRQDSSQQVSQQVAHHMGHPMHQQMRPLEMRPHPNMKYQDMRQHEPRRSLEMRHPDMRQHEPRPSLEMRRPDMRQHEPRPSLEMRHPDMRQHEPRPSLEMRHSGEVRPPMEARPSADMRQAVDSRTSLELRRPLNDPYRRQQPGGHTAYDAHQHGPVAAVPHDPYPQDGMTMLCRTGPSPISDRSSQVTSARPSSRDSQSDYSNPNSFSSIEPPSGKTSPVKQEPIMPEAIKPEPPKQEPVISEPIKQEPVKQELVKPEPVKKDLTPAPSPVKLVAKKKSGGFLKNHSPFRRKSNKELQQSSRNTWHASNAQSSASPTRRPQLQTQEPASVVTKERTQSPEPIDANASLALGVGQNVFPVSNPDAKRQPGTVAAAEKSGETDPIALALAELKGVTLGKNSSVRQSADHYHGINTPVPGSEAASRQPSGQTSATPTVPTLGNQEAAAVKRGTPPPSYQTPVSRLGVPPPAVTSRAMKEATKKATSQTRNMFENGRGGPGGYNAPASRSNTRATETKRAEPALSQSVPPTASRPGTRTPNHSRGESVGYGASPTARPSTRATDHGRGEAGSYSSASMSRSGTRATEMGPTEKGGYSTASMPRPGTRGTETGRAENGGFGTPPVARTGTRATDMSRADTRGFNASPLSRPGTRGSDMSRGGSGIYGSSPGSRPGTRGTDMPRAASPAPTRRSISPQPPVNDNMSYRSVSPNPYAASQRSPSVMSSPQKHGSAQGYYPQSPQQTASRGPSPSPYSQYNRPGSSYAGSDMAVQLAPCDDPYGSQRSRGSRPASRAMSYYDDGSTRQRSQSVADPSRLYTGDGRPILHYARALYMYQAAIPEELSFAKGDYLAVLRHQDDGWWEAEVHGGDGRIGLVPKLFFNVLMKFQETLQETARVVTSKPVQRAVVNTVLLISGAVTLLCTAAIASTLFFRNFLPHEVVTLPLHLQYGSGINPYGIASLQTPPLKTHQEYDVSLTLSMPRSNPNLERGNFMISLHMLDSKDDLGLRVEAERHASLHNGFETANALFSSRRPALFPYVDPLVSLASRVLFLFYHMFAPGSSTKTMIIPLAERVLFSKDLGVPKSAYVEVEAGQTIQVYNAHLQLTAQLRGLRWLMVHYRISTFLAFTLLFWVFEVTFMGVAWGIWSSAIGLSPGSASTKAQRLGGATYNQEDENTDHAETFPTYGRQQPLKYEPDVKEELSPEQPLSEIPRAGADADDEDEGSFDEDVQHRDSGIGTSYSEEGSSSIRRRASHNRM